MTIEAEPLLGALAFVGLVLATGAYYLLIARRKSDGIAADDRERAASQRRAKARFRHLQRWDDD